MNKKVENLSEQRNKKKPRSIEESAKAAVRRFCDPELVDSVDEPEGLASGKTTESGSFVHEDDKEEEENKDEN